VSALIPQFEYAPETCAQYLMRLSESLVRAEFAVAAFEWPEAANMVMEAARCADKLGERVLFARIVDFHSKCFTGKEVRHESAMRGVRMLLVYARETARESDTRYVPTGAP